MNIGTNVTGITIPEGAAKNIKRGTEMLWQDGGLPTAFQRCEYIESHGTERISTGWYPSTLSKIKTRIKNTAAPSVETAFGCRNGIGASQPDFTLFICDVIGTKGFAIHWCFNGSSSADTGYRYKDDTKVFRDITFGYDGLFVDGTSYYSPPQITGDATCVYPFTAFAIMEQGSYFRKYCSLQMASLSCYSPSGEIERNYIPAYLKTAWNGIPAGTIGLYDLCGSLSSNGTPFYTNAGTGAFTKGADVV